MRSEREKQRLISPCAFDRPSPKRRALGKSHEPPLSYWQSMEEIDKRSLCENFIKRLDLSDYEPANKINKTTVKKIKTLGTDIITARATEFM